MAFRNRKKQPPAGTKQAMFGARTGIARPNGPAGQGKLSYKDTLVARMCIDMVADKVASLPTRWMRDGEVVENPTEPQALLITDTPIFSYRKLSRQLVKNYLTYGEAFIWFVRGDRTGRVVGLYAPSPETVSQSPGFWSFSRENGLTTQSLVVPEGDMIRVFEPQPGRAEKEYPIGASAWRELTALQETAEQQAASLKNRLQPSTLFVEREPVADDVWQKMRNTLKSSYEGSSNSGRGGLVPKGFEPMFVPVTLEGSGVTEQARHLARMIAEAYKVPSLLLGFENDNTFANYHEAQRVLIRRAVLPIWHDVILPMWEWLGEEYGNAAPLVPTLWLDEVPEFILERSQRMKDLAAVDFLTLNEKRERVGLEPVEGGDQLLVNTGLIPLSDVDLDPPAPVE